MAVRSFSLTDPVLLVFTVPPTAIFLCTETWNEMSILTDPYRRVRKIITHNIAHSPDEL